MRRSIRLIAVLVMLGGALWADPVIQLIGSSGTVGDGGLLVPIGLSGGWGFQITNDSATLWMASTLSDFCPGGVFISPCSNPFGPYTDRYGPDFVVVAPLTTVIELFDVPAGDGTGAIALTSPGIHPGDVVSGQVFFVYDNYDGDPNSIGNQVGGDVVFGVDASVTAEEATPEPRAWSLVALGLAAFSAVRLRQRRHRAIPGGS